ncbi:Protein of unknown function DUF2273 [Syntrophomonas zehnderi OL-4]|uniref:Small integral membrane protein n=1 Tax=Syntrophomonas zehnderi OL-4 TaxID=690567 RepID=A0A0E4GAY1_9FIRM|nr:DUF2273 domain-containing protein [Syntrophomonas zehnderi]CFX49495.1 Protein of unknown function DUF2273 [Syntrophomonas zehnderi OL-4]
MLEKLFMLIITEHRGKFIGILLGLLASILFISYGFWRTIFVIFCIAMGYFIGKKIDESASFEIWIKNLFKEK